MRPGAVYSCFSKSALVLSRCHQEGLRHRCFAHLARFLSRFSVPIGRGRHKKEFHDVFGAAAIAGCVLEECFSCGFKFMFDVSVRPLNAYGASNYVRTGRLASLRIERNLS